MEDKSLELLTSEQRKLHEEFKLCKTEEDFQRWEKKAKSINESQAAKRGRLDMTLEEFDAKYKLATYEDIKKHMCDK